VDVLDVLMAQVSRLGARRRAWSDPGSPGPRGRAARSEVLVDALIAAAAPAGPLLLFSRGWSGAHGSRSASRGASTPTRWAPTPRRHQRTVRSSSLINTSAESSPGRDER
jgi:hypothetical protein